MAFDDLKRTNQLYAQYVNRLHARSGHLWQDRFYSCPFDRDHFWRALAYIERNLVRAHLCRMAWEWRWSSAGAHCGASDPAGLLDLAAWRRDMEPRHGHRILDESDNDELLTRLRLCTSRGRPPGSDAFIAKLETFAAVDCGPCRAADRRNRPIRPPSPTTRAMPKEGT
jgi:putative transposase